MTQRVRKSWMFVLALSLLVGGLIAWPLCTTDETFPPSGSNPLMAVTTYHNTVPSLMSIAGVVLLAGLSLGRGRSRSR
jgi:hypothetical protein